MHVTISLGIISNSWLCLPFLATVFLNLSTAVCFSLLPPQELNYWKIYRKLNKFLLVVHTALLSLVGKTQCFVWCFITGCSRKLKKRCLHDFEIFWTVLIYCQVRHFQSKSKMSLEGGASHSLLKHPFVLALRRWGRFARRNVCDSGTEIPYWWRKSMFT